MIIAKWVKKFLWGPRLSTKGTKGYGSRNTQIRTK